MENTSLLVEGLPDDLDRVRSKVELYFKNKRRSGGEIVQVREHEEDKRKALLVYLKEEDLQRVLDKGVHNVDFRDHGAVQVTVRLPDQRNTRKKSKPAVLPKPEKSVLLKSLQVTPVQTEAAAKGHKDNDKDLETPDLLITSTRSLDKETLQMYFEQFTEQFELAKHANNSWILKLYSQADVEEVLAKEEHEFGLSIAVHTEAGLAETWDPRRFILTGFDGTTELDMISVFIGSCSKTTNHTWEPLDEDRIVVTFRQDIDVKSFMRKCTSKLLQGRDIGVTRMERTDSVLIRGDLETISEDILTLYFSNKKRSGGGETQSFIWINRRNSAVITFSSTDDAYAVVEQKHSVCNTDIQTALFYSSLQKALTGEKPNLAEINTRLTIPVSEDLLHFLESNERSRKQLESAAGLLNAEVLIDSRAAAGEMTLEMNINTNTLAALHIGPGWESRSMREVQSLLSLFDTVELSVETDVWRRVESDCRSFITTDTVLSYRQNSSKVIITGAKAEVGILSEKTQALVKIAAAELEEERNTIEVQIQLDSRETFDLVSQSVQAQLGQVNPSFNEKQQIISLRGAKESVGPAQALIRQAQENILTQQLTLSSHLIHFIQSLNLQKLEREHFFNNHIPARLANRENGLWIVVAKEHLKGVKDKISEILKEQVIQLSSSQSEETWTRFLRSLQEETNEVSLTTADAQLTICGFSSAVVDVAGKVKRYLENKEPMTESVALRSVREAEFVESCLNLSELVDLRRLGATVLTSRTPAGPHLKVTAAKDSIREAVEVVQKQLSSIIVEKHKCGRAGEAKVLEKHQANVKSKAKERRCGLFLSKEHPVTSAPPKSFTHRIDGHMSLTVTQGELQHFIADALVCPMNKSLDFSNPVAQRFLHFGGESITEVCKSQQRQKQCLLPGDVMVSAAGKLSTKTLIYTVLPLKGQSLDARYLQSAVSNSLMKAEDNGCTSVAVPAVGCETFGFSVKDSCAAIRAAVLWFSQSSPKNIQNITIVDPEEKIVEEFNALILELGFPDVSPKVPLQSLRLKYRSDRTVLINGVPIFLQKSDITKEAVDVIVNSTNKSLDLNTGVSGAIFKAAGKRVVDECKKQAPLKAGAVVLTSAGDLQCHSIAQMVGPENITDITASLGKILDLCEGKQATSLAIPAIGTGRGGFEPRDSIKAMLTAIEKHLKEPNSSFLKRITVVALEQQIYEAFREYFKVWNKPAYGKMPENQVKIGSARIEVKKGDITTETVRGVVNTTNRDMSLRGGVSGAIFKAAGASVEQECQKHGPLQGDEAAVTGAGDLQCDVILHMVGPHTAAETRSRVRKVLEHCEQKQITTVSFPAVGTGGGGVQAVDAVTAMLQGFEDHLAHNTSTVIKLIYIVIDRNNILQEFQKGLKAWKANTEESESEEEDCSSTEDSSSSDQDASANPVEVVMGPVKVKVSCGDITKEKVQAIVNSTNTSLDLSSGVSGAILKASGPTVANECKAKAPQPADGVVLTKAGNLTNIQHIVHMVGQTNETGISSSMYKVLKMCEENHIQSVSFPALGTGAGLLVAARVANAMTKALSDFVKDSPKHLKRIHIVIFQQKLLPDFQEALKRCKKISLNPSVRQVQPLHTAKPPPALCLARETAAVSFPIMAVEVYGMSRADLAEVKRLVDDLLMEECDSKDVQSRHVADLTDSDKKAIVNLSRANQVSVQVKSLDKLTVSGKRDDVLDAVLKINEFIQEAREREIRGGEVKRLRETLCWEVVRGERWQPLDPAVSYDIELAFHRKQNSFQFQENGDTFTVDFGEMKLSNSQQQSVRIKRSLLGDSDTAIIHPPPTWSKMDGRDLEIVPVQSDSEEYKKIEAEFVNSSKHPNVSPVQVQQIDRIQSQSQWQRYSVLKQAVDKKYPKQSNERRLYHGTTRDICQKINKNGFNRSFCGRNAVVHGDGTYFAGDAWYSCHDQYSNPDERGLKYVYRARVVTGSLCKSRPGMKEPDPINAADPQAGLHDCAVDSLQKPFIFVVFCDAGAYPEYLITFKSL